MHCRAAGRGDRGATSAADDCPVVALARLRRLGAVWRRREHQGDRDLGAGGRREVLEARDDVGLHAEQH
eukprot:3540596-Pyramimonas_sp.AAC.1